MSAAVRTHFLVSRAGLVGSITASLADRLSVRICLQWSVSIFGRSSFTGTVNPGWLRAGQPRCVGCVTLHSLTPVSGQPDQALPLQVSGHNHVSIVGIIACWPPQLRWTGLRLEAIEPLLWFYSKGFGMASGAGVEKKRNPSVSRLGSANRNGLIKYAKVFQSTAFKPAKHLFISMFGLVLWGIPVERVENSQIAIGLV